MIGHPKGQCEIPRDVEPDVLDNTSMSTESARFFRNLLTGCGQQP